MKDSPALSEVKRGQAKLVSLKKDCEDAISRNLDRQVALNKDTVKLKADARELASVIRAYQKIIG